MIDMYRITLLKNKIRASISGVEGIRFTSSRDRSHLFIDVFMRYYSHQKEVAALISSGLTRAKIEHTVVKDRFGLYWDRPEGSRPVDYVSIPVDQEALPERKRPSRESRRTRARRGAVNTRPTRKSRASKEELKY